MTINMKNDFLSMQHGLTTNSLKLLADSMKKTNAIASSFSSINEVSKSLAMQMKPFNDVNKIFGVALTSQLSQISKSLANAGISSVLSEMSKTNKIISDSFTELAKSQLHLSNSLAEVSKAFSDKNVNQFNALNVALQGVSRSYLSGLVRKTDLSESDLDFISETNNVISNITDDFVDDHSGITHQNLDDLRTSIITDLTVLLSKTSTERNKIFLFDLIAIIGLILSFYGTFGTHESLSDKSNSEIYIESKKDIDDLRKELLTHIDEKFNNSLRSRISRTSVILRYSSKSNSKKIGVIKPGQKITVIEIRHKYILIMYFDKDTGEPKSGFALKKYFDLLK